MHTWRVRARNCAGNGPWSATATFAVQVAIVPGAPSAVPGTTLLVGPMGTVTTRTPTFSWSRLAQGTDYYLWVSDTGGNTVFSRVFSWSFCTTTTCAVTPDVSLMNGGYTWWVQARNSAGNGPWSTGLAITVNVAPPVATQVGPTGSTNNPTPTYTWNEVSGAVEYQLWVTILANDQIVVNQWYPSTVCTAGVCSATPPTPLAQGQHNWWIRAKFCTGPGPWSAGMTFTKIP
jgi:hypothetical protein